MEMSLRILYQSAHYALVVASLLGKARVSSADVMLTVLSPIPDYTYHPRLNANGTYQKCLDFIIAIVLRCFIDHS